MPASISPGPSVWTVRVCVWSSGHVFIQEDACRGSAGTTQINQSINQSISQIDDEIDLLPDYKDNTFVICKHELYSCLALTRNSFMSQFQRAPRNFRRVCNITLVNGSDLSVSRIFYSPTSAPAPKDPHQSNRQYRGNNVSEIWSPHKTPTRTFFICTLNTHQCFHTLSAVRL